MDLLTHLLNPTRLVAFTQGGVKGMKMSQEPPACMGVISACLFLGMMSIVTSEGHHTQVSCMTLLE